MLDLRVNISKSSSNNHNQQVIQAPAFIKQNPPNMAQPIKTKNVPNGLLRRATGGTQGRQTSIGNLSTGKVGS